MLGYIRFFLIDLLTSWRILLAYDEINKSFFDSQHLDSVKALKVLKINKLLSSINSRHSNIDEHPFTDKVFYRQNENYKFEKSEHLVKHTGGSTGVPFEYLASKSTQGFLWAGILVSLRQVGYKLGDKILFIGGSSVASTSFKKNIFYSLANITLFSSFGFDEIKFNNLYKSLKTKKIKFIYGYSSAIFEFAKFCKDKNLKLEGVICTAEMLNEVQRQFIEESFNCIVLRQYGVNDGGLSSFECPKKNGYHIIENRSKVSTDSDGNLVCTDLINTSQLFIKYKVGDKGVISTDSCDCGCVYPRIVSLKGRSNDIIKDSANKKYHSEYFTHFFRDYTNVTKWQVISQNNQLELRLETIPGSSEEYFQLVVSGFNKKIKNETSFETVKVKKNCEFIYSKNGKFKFVLESGFE